jgi:hypothetical protein
MAIHTLKNQYRGVNAHLHSKLQRESDTPSMFPAFHAALIINMVQTLNVILYPLGYQAVGEQSLQIRFDDVVGARPIPDLTIYDSPRTASPALAPATFVTPTLAISIEATLEKPQTYKAVIIYHSIDTAEHGDFGKPIVRFEILSPTNKSGDDSAYRYKRAIALETGLVLVELDYLHETPTPIKGLPHYPYDTHSYPYNITISDPRQPIDKPSVFFYGFAVDVPLPVLKIPLVGEDILTYDFGIAYDLTFQGGLWGKQVDYATEPERMHTYRADDQHTIRALMQTIQMASTSGQNLETFSH